VTPLASLAEAPAALFLAGLLIVLVGADMVLRSASRLASMLKVSPILIGLTVVSVGTSTPELAIGIAAAQEGRGPLAVGNIAGTNIVNILLILGLSAWIRPLPTRSLSVRLDVPVMIVCALALFIMSADGVLGRAEGALMLLGAVSYTVALVRMSRRERAPLHLEFAQEYGQAAMRPGTGWRRGAAYCTWLAAGMAVTVVGADWLVSGATEIARTHGVSDAFIGLTIVAIGTSAPELVTTLLATARDDRDVAIGNLIGSSIYNILVILGLTVLAAPAGVDVSDEILWIDLPLAAMVAVICLPVFRSDRQVSRTEGALFVLGYLVYLGSLLWLRS